MNDIVCVPGEFLRRPPTVRIDRPHTCGFVLIERAPRGRQHALTVRRERRMIDSASVSGEYLSRPATVRIDCPTPVRFCTYLRPSPRAHRPARTSHECHRLCPRRAPAPTTPPSASIARHPCGFVPIRDRQHALTVRRERRMSDRASVPGELLRRPLTICIDRPHPCGFVTRGRRQHALTVRRERRMSDSASVPGEFLRRPPTVRIDCPHPCGFVTRGRHYALTVRRERRMSDTASVPLQVS